MVSEMRLGAAVLVVMCAMMALAMPSQEELKKAQSLVIELMAPSLEALKEAGSKERAAAAVKVGDASYSFAMEAETEAAKFMLLKGAVSFYVRGGDYDKAGDALQALKTEIKSVSPSVICEIVGRRRVETKTPKLYAHYWLARLQMRAAADAKKLLAPRSAVSQRRYAEDLAISKGWAAASMEFAKVNNAPLWKTLDDKNELKDFERGDFWWVYEPALEDADNFFRLYAASLYKKSLEAREIPGLKKNIVEKRLADLPAWMTYLLDSGIEVCPALSSVVAGPIEIKTVNGSPFTVRGDSAVLKLKSGYEVEFVKCPAGEFDMSFGNRKVQRVKITRPFWISKIPMEDCLDCDLNDPVKREGSQRYLRRNSGEILSIVDRFQRMYSSYIPKGYALRPPSIAELQYAFCANETSSVSPYNYLYLRDRDKGKVFRRRAGADAKLEPNAWGMYDFGGFEIVVDSVDVAKVEKWEDQEVGKYYELPCLETVSDPFYWSREELPTEYIMDRSAWWTSKRCEGTVHLVIGPDLVSEWKARHGKK